MWSLKLSLLSKIMPKYFILLTCLRSLLFKYMFSSFRSLLLRRVTSITFDFCSLKLDLLFFAHSEILFSSMLVMFSTSSAVFALLEALCHPRMRLLLCGV
jgi:hypothetical protein